MGSFAARVISIVSKPRLALAITTAGLICWLFWPALTGQASFAFRDAAHFYHPLFEWTRDQWGAGRVPLWNPHENLGVPLVGENTSSVFYPGKLLFALPGDFTLLYNWYILGHLAFAAASAYALARHYRLSATAALLAAVAYAFSGNVLFQCYNVVFLVGAAWLPLAVLAADRMLRGRSFWAAVGLGATLALMTLGGDPQMAYNAGLLAVLAAFFRWRARNVDPRNEAVPSAKARWRSGVAVLLAVAALSGGALSAIQILPSVEATRLTARGTHEAPRNVVELAARWIEGEDPEADWPPKWNAALLGRRRDAHQRRIYEFSVPPWRAVEFLWPNVSGRMFPTYRRWAEALEIERRVWTPSFYMGLLPFVFAASAWKLRKGGPAHLRFLSWAVLLSAVGESWRLRLGLVRARVRGAFWPGRS